MFTLNGDPVEIVKEFKYLGVVFTQNGRFNRNIKQISDLAGKAMQVSK